jgi:hypothetical protein
MKIKIINYIKGLSQNHQKLLLTILALICIGFAIYWIINVIHALQYPSQVDYGEGYIVYISHMFADGTWKWDINTEPYLTTMYGVVYYVLMYPLIHIFGDGLWVGRLLSIIPTGISCVFTGLIVYHFTKNKLLAIIGCLLPLLHPIIRDWSVQARVDCLAVMFSIIGVWIAVKYEKTRWFWLSLVCFILAFHTKMNIVGFSAVCLYLLLNRNIKKVLIFGLIGTGLMLLPLIIFPDLANHMFWYNIPTKADYSLAATLRNNTLLILPMVGILFMAGFYVLKNKKTFPTAWLISAFLINGYLCTGAAGFINYFVENIYVASLCAVLVIPTVFEYARNNIRWKTTDLALIVFVAIVPMMPSNIHIFPSPDKAYELQNEIVMQLIADTDKPIPSENVGLLVNSDKQVEMELYIFNNLAEYGMWDDTNYINKYKTQWFDYIILRIPIEERLDGDGHFSKEVIELISENYTLIYKSDYAYYWFGFSIYVSNTHLEEVGIENYEAIIN